MKVYLVFQPDCQYGYVDGEPYGVYSTREKAEEVKKELDKKVVTEENLWTIVPEEIYKNWPSHPYQKGHVTRLDDWEFDSEYQGYTIQQYNQQEERWYDYIKEYYPAEIKEYEVIE